MYFGSSWLMFTATSFEPPRLRWSPLRADVADGDRLVVRQFALGSGGVLPRGRRAGLVDEADRAADAREQTVGVAADPAPGHSNGLASVVVGLVADCTSVVFCVAHLAVVAARGARGRWLIGSA